MTSISTHRGARRLAALLAAPLALLLLAPGAALAGAQTRSDAVESVMDRIADGDCGMAVSRLKTGLGLEYPEMMELAGSMYENGLCVKRDWQRAVTFYVQAHGAGVRSAASRLAAGYADPANGPDVAAALWWAETAGTRSSAACKVGKTDPDAFVAELGRWPQEKLTVCNYITGVMATLSGELRYPARAGSLGVGGAVALRFHAGVPRIDVRMSEREEFRLLGIMDGEDLRDRGTRAVTGSFESELRRVSDRALKRYPHPGGIPADTTIDTRFEFTVSHE